MAAKTAVKTPAKKTTTAKRVVKRKSNEKLVAENRAYVPDPSVADGYVGRKVFDQWDAHIAQTALEENHNILLDGPTGAGKTLFGEAFASKHQMLYYSLPCDVSIDPSAITGRVQPAEGTEHGYKWVDGPLTQIFREGGLFNISEGNMMMPKIAASLYSVLDGRRYISLLGHEGEVVRAHLGTKGRRKCWCNLSAAECNSKRVLIIMDMNGKYRGTMELNAAFKNRFKYKLPWGYDEAVEEKLVQFPTLRDIARRIRDMDTEIYTPVSTNMLMEFESITLGSLGVNFAIQNFMSAFEADEQQPISKVIELLRSKLDDDIKFIAKSASAFAGVPA
jgi:hypothetical protein